MGMDAPNILKVLSRIMSLRFPTMNLYIKIDEHCHRLYDASSDAARLDTIQYGQASGNGKLLPSIMLRFNPNMTNGGGCEVSLLGRIKTLAQRYRKIVAALPVDYSCCEFFATMSVQYMFYGSDLQHRDILDRAQATVTALEDINTECFQYDDDISTFQLADITSREIDMMALKACEETLDCSAAVSKQCSARSSIGKPTERQCTGFSVKGTDLCARHTKQAMAKLVTSKRKRE
jgi:hypothetical protein